MTGEPEKRKRSKSSASASVEPGLARQDSAMLPKVTAVDLPNEDSDGVTCERLADEVREVLLCFHRDVGSPLAATGLILELVQTEASLGKESRERLSQAVRDLDHVITTVRSSVEQLRKMERRLRSHGETH